MNAHNTKKASGSRQNVLLLFAKLPEPGKVKTRLSILKDGIFSPEDACRLFGAMLLDVIETCLLAFDDLSHASNGNGNGNGNDCTDDYKLVVSTSPISNIDAMGEFIRKGISDLLARCPSLARFPIEVIGDSGPDFDHHYNDAFEQVWDGGADCILSMGADMPALTVEDVVRGFIALHEHPDYLAISPDQEMGVSLIGWTADIDFDHTGVFYNASGLTVLPAYIHKARAKGIPIKYLPPVPDVDTMADLAHNVTLIEALLYETECGNSPTQGSPAKRKGPFRTDAVLKDLGIDGVKVPPNELRDDRAEIDELPIS